MARQFLTAIDLAKNELQNAAIQNLGSAPSAPVKGQLYFNSTGGDNTLYWWDGSIWNPAKASSSVPLSNSASSLVPGTGPTGGAASDASRGDHVHGLPAFAAVTAQTAFGQASANGSAATFIRSDHAHGTPTHDAAAHAAISISALAGPTANLNIGGYKLTNVATPTAATEGANKQYVDDTVNGLSWKDAVRYATTANHTLSGLSAGSVDGSTPGVGDRILVKNQTTASQNGIYVAAVGAWTRAADADATGELDGAAVFVAEGTTMNDTSWVVTNTLGIVIGTTAITWVQFGGPGMVVGGAGLTLTGNTLDVGAGTGITVAADTVALDLTYADGRYANVAGDTFAGAVVFNGEAVAPLAPSSGTRLANKDYVDTTVAAATKRYAAALTGTASPEVVTHNLNTRDVVVQVLNGASPYQAVETDVEATTVNTVTLRYNPNLGAGWRVVVLA